MRASVLVSTYDMPYHLALVLAGLERQSTRDFEVLVCDDGSGPDTKTLIELTAKGFPMPIRHFWQEHQGFRKCRILNQALRAARGEVMIFLDGDCVPHRDYVRDHLEQQEKGRYLAGRRVELGEKLSRQLTVEQVQAGYFDRPRLSLIWSALSGDTQHLQRSVRISDPAWRKRLGMERIDDMKGCNYSVPKRALEELNGFDEEYEGYGREDTDVELRLQNMGLTIKSMKGLAIQFHVWHPRREFTPKNDDRLEALKKSRRVRCQKGLVDESIRK